MPFARAPAPARTPCSRRWRKPRKSKSGKARASIETSAFSPRRTTVRSRNSSRGAYAAMLFFAACARAQSPPVPKPEEKPASIEGEVRNSITLAPVERAHVSIRRTNAADPDRYGALTDAAGKFVIAAVPPGNYILQMDRTAYVDLTAAPANQFRLSAGEKREGVKLKLIPTGQIA